MTFLEFDRPGLLWAAVGAAALVFWLGRRRAAGTGSTREFVATLLRTAAVLLALVAAAGPHRLVATERPWQVLLATNGPVLITERGKIPRFSDFLRGESRRATIPQSVAQALSSRDPEGDALLVAEIASPVEHEAAAVEALRDTGRLGIPVFVRGAEAVVAPPHISPVSPWLEGISVPPDLVAGEPFPIRPRLADAARDDAAATVRFTIDGRDAGAWSPKDALPPAVTLAAGTHLVAAECHDGSGALRGAATATIDVAGPPSVLVIEEGAAPSPLARALEVQGIPVRRVAPAAAAAHVAAASVIVLGAGAKGDAALEGAVRNGKGLLVAGAPGDARGLGRFRGGPMERALPVFLPPPPPPPPPAPPPDDTPPPPGKDPEPKTLDAEHSGAVVTLLLVVDSSGSMFGTKMEMARRAAAAAAATLGPQDRFGLISFTDEPLWQVPLGPAGETRRIEAALRNLHAGGQTDLLPALREARRALRREKTAVRHIIVFSDGETSPFGMRTLVEGIAAEGTTVSVVGIGSEFDARLLGNVALWGKGRIFPAIDPATIPQIVTLDAQRLVEAGKEALAKAKPTPDFAPPPTEKKEPPRKPEKPPAPASPAPRAAIEAADPCALLDGLGPAWPAAVPPDAAPEARMATTLALRFADGRGPALVLGRHGLGRTAVLSFDPSDWAGDAGFAAVAARVVRGLAPSGPGAPVEVLSVEPSRDGTRVVIEVRGSGEGPLPVPRVDALDPAGDTPSALAVARVGARTFAATLPPGRPGPRALAIRTGGPEDAGLPAGFFDPGPPPPSPPDPALAERLARASGATYLPRGAPLPSPPSRPGPPKREPAGLPLVVLAALLLVADTGLRRTGRN